MAELFGVDLTTHLRAVLSEYQDRQSIYGYPDKKIFRGSPGYDFSVGFHEKKPFTPLGPASGPHTQMVQNILLAFLGGGRIMELKTVQILDQLEIPRPCIDVRNIGFNVEWSQELRLEDSLEEYLVAWVLLKILEEEELLGIPKGDPFYQTVFDISVGYDLKGISSPEVNSWLKRIMNAGDDIQRILDGLPDEFARFKKLVIDPLVANSTTLSTFHGCPRDEIESIVKHLISEHGLNVIVKMNPTLPGYDFVNQTLRESLGYQHIELDPAAFEHDLQFDEAVEMMRRLQQFAGEHGRRLGAKFTNTLVVKNHDKIFTDEVMYLSGEPLHVISMNAMQRFREAMGDDFHISFSAGVSKQNFSDAVLCNMKPVTTCSDLLKTGGYTRMFDYLRNLQREMEKSGVSDIESLIKLRAGEDNLSLAAAGMINARRIVPALVGNPRYHHEKNRKIPRKIDSHLELFDCITCNKCLPVCPNAANFSIPAGEIDIEQTNYVYRDGDFIPEPKARFVLAQPAQIANLADFCNECGDCDTYCPEYGGPFIEKPRFFSSGKTYKQFSTHDGFWFPTPDSMIGRIAGREFILAFNSERNVYLWKDGEVEFLLDEQHQFISGYETDNIQEGATIDMRAYHTFRTLFDGIRSDRENYAAVLLLQRREH